MAPKRTEQQRQIDTALAQGRALRVWIVSHVFGAAVGAVTAVAATESGALRVFEAVHPGVPALGARPAAVRDVASVAFAAYCRA